MSSIFDPDVLRLIGIDPGTNHCGFSVLSLNIETLKITVETAYTVRSNKFVTGQKFLCSINGDKEAKLKGYREHMKKLCERVAPYIVGSEAPFMGRFPAAYGALKEVTMVLRTGAMDHDWTMPFLFIEPTPLKKFMGVKGTSSDKNLMTEALRKREDLIWPDDLTVDDLDEHSVDATCCALYFVDKVLERINS